jgi:hypothetical protein
MITRSRPDQLVTDAWRCIRGDLKPRSLGILCLLALTLLLGAQNASAQLYYDSNGQTAELTVAQLYYEGYWNFLDWFNGTIARMGRDDLVGHIAYEIDHPPPHEPSIMKAQEAGAVAFLACRVSSNAKIPGAAMYSVDGSDRHLLKIPVFEIVVRRETHEFFSLPMGSPIAIHPQPNQFYKVANTKFQLIFNLILSFFEIGIIAVGSYRIYQFWIYGSGKLYISIGPICLSLEIVGAFLRLIYTIVDPFYTYRMLTERASSVLISISWPFTLSAGILLTFFWAEALSRSSVQAKPFISVYRVPAIVVVVCLFLIEIICSALRVTLNGKVSFSPNYVSTFVYFVISIALIVCYIWTAIAVARRLNSMEHVKARRSIVNMTIRVGVSSLGYIIFAACMILFLFVASRPWGLTIIMNMAFLGHNFAAMMQVVALRPNVARVSSSSNPTAQGTGQKSSRSVSMIHASKSHSHGEVTSPLNDYTTDEETVGGGRNQSSNESSDAEEAALIAPLQDTTTTSSSGSPVGESSEEDS